MKKKRVAAAMLAATMTLTSAFSGTLTAHAAELTQTINQEDVNYGAVVTGENADAIKSMFDATYYANTNGDVVKHIKEALGENISDEVLAQALFEHFCTSGIYEGRSLSKDFNVSAFASANDDLKEAFGSDILSYYLYAVSHDLATEGRTITTLAQAAAAGITVTSVTNPAVSVTPAAYERASILGINNLDVINALESGATVYVSKSNVATIIKDNAISSVVGVDAPITNNIPGTNTNKETNTFLIADDAIYAIIDKFGSSTLTTSADKSRDRGVDYYLIADTNNNAAIFLASDITTDGTFDYDKFVKASPISYEDEYDVNDVLVTDNDGTKTLVNYEVMTPFAVNITSDNGSSKKTITNVNSYRYYAELVYTYGYDMLSDNYPFTYLGSDEEGNTVEKNTFDREGYSEATEGNGRETTTKVAIYIDSEHRDINFLRLYDDGSYDLAGTVIMMNKQVLDQTIKQLGLSNVYYVSGEKYTVDDSDDSDSTESTAGETTNTTENVTSETADATDAETTVTENVDETIDKTTEDVTSSENSSNGAEDASVDEETIPAE